MPRFECGAFNHSATSPEPETGQKRPRMDGRRECTQCVTDLRRELRAKKSGRDPEPVSIEEMEDQAVDLAVAYTIGWDGIAPADEAAVARVATVGDAPLILSFIRELAVKVKSSSRRENGARLESNGDHFGPAPLTDQCHSLARMVSSCSTVTVTLSLR